MCVCVQCIAETTNLAMCSVELKQILHSIIRPHNVMSTQQVSTQHAAIELMCHASLHAALHLIQLNDATFPLRFNQIATVNRNFKLPYCVSLSLSPSLSPPSGRPCTRPCTD